MPPQDKTPLGDAMTHRFPEQKIPAKAHDVPSPGDKPPTSNPDPQPGDDKPSAPPAPEDEPGRRYIPIDLPGQPHAPERVN
jgi:hypothetical protein